MAEIDKAYKQANDLLSIADVDAEKAKAIRMKGDPKEAWMAEDAERACKKARKRAESLLSIRCSLLKDKLAEFRTPQLPALDNGDITLPARLR